LVHSNGPNHGRIDSVYYFSEDTLMWSMKSSNECFGKRSTMDTRRSPNDVKVFDVHGHPTFTWEKVYGCPPDDKGRLFQRGPWDTLDTSHRLERFKQADSTGGGGSIGDWLHWRGLTENAVPMAKQPPEAPTVGGVVINADGEVWIVFPELLTNPSAWFSNKRKVRWTQNVVNPSCNWRTR
jgi:hypothetical protein